MPGKTPLLTISDVLRAASRNLQPKRITCSADKNLGQLEAELLLSHVLKKERTWLFAHDDEVLSKTSLGRFKELVVRRLKHEPIAYLTGVRDFYGLEFHVTKSTLIPRSESEMLVDLVREKLFPEPSLTDLVWDVGTGSGALAISIASTIHPRNVIASDISSKALATAKQNAKTLNVKNVTFLKADLLDATARRMFEKHRNARLVIVANLPYLPTSDKKKLTPDVVKFEPSSALFVGKDGTELIEKLLRQLATYDIHFSSAFFEFDPPQAKKLRMLVKKLFPKATVKIHKDLAKRERVLEISTRKA